MAAVVQLPDELSTTTEAENSGLISGTQTATVSNRQSISREKIEAIIKNAVGFDELRGDQIEVVAATLAPEPELAAPTGMLPFVNNYLPFIKAISLGVASIVALILGMLVLRKMQPVVVGDRGEESLSPEMVERLNNLSAQMQENPEIVTTVLASWLKSEHESDNQSRKAA